MRRSAVKSRPTGSLKLGVEPFELRHQVGAARGVAGRVNRAPAPLGLERRQLREELVAVAVQLTAARTLVGPLASARGAPRSAGEDDGGERQREILRPRRPMRQAGEGQADGAARANPAPLAPDQPLPPAPHPPPAFPPPPRPPP